MTSKKTLLRKLLKGIETGDPEAATVVDESRYIQHNPRTGDGSPGLAELFARLAKTNPKVKFVRVFEDGDFAFAHNEYDFSEIEVAFEVFRFDDDKAVEHWDNIQIAQPANPSGRNMLDGETKIADHHKTEVNRALVDSLTQKIFIERQFSLLDAYFAKDLIQHDFETADGLVALQELLEATQNGEPKVTYMRIHRILAEGNFVLCMSEGMRDGHHSGLYDLFRIANDKVVEHWNTTSPIAPRSEWKNDNGKF